MRERRKIKRHRGIIYSCVLVMSALHDKGTGVGTYIGGGFVNRGSQHKGVPTSLTESGQ